MLKYINSQTLENSSTFGRTYGTIKSFVIFPSLVHSLTFRCYAQLYYYLQNYIDMPLFNSARVGKVVQFPKAAIEIGLSLSL